MNNIDNNNFKENQKINNKNEEYEALHRSLKEAQEKLETHMRKTEFLSNISHEFKTPLNIIMGAMQLIDLYTLNGTIKDPDKKLQKYLNIMMLNSRRLLRLINNIIDLSKIDCCFIDISMHNHNIVAIVDTVMQSINLYAREKNINITYIKEIDEKIIACDEDKIERILLNLISNALKFTGTNGNIEVKLGQENGAVIISVKDDGIGIPIEKQQIIFQRFSQIDRTLNGNQEGSGIGLFIVKALVEMHKGTITLESEYKKGSTFTVKIPDKLVSDVSVTDSDAQLVDKIDERVKIEFSDL